MPEETDAVAILAVLNAALSPKVVYDYDEIPSPRPDEYVEFSLSPRLAGEQRIGGGTGGLSGRRILARYISHASVSNARLMRQKVYGVLGSPSAPTTLTIGSDSVGVVWEGGTSIGPDDGWFSGYDTWTCA